MPTFRKNDAASVHSNHGKKIVMARTICRPARELYDLCRDLGRLMLVTKETTQIAQHSQTRFTLTLPGQDWSVTAKIINDRPGQLIAWRSEEGSDFPHAGSIRFDAAPGDEGTEIIVMIEYEGGWGKRGGALSKLAGPGAHIDETLRRFKAFVEAGEIPTIDGQPVGEPQKSKKK